MKPTTRERLSWLYRLGAQLARLALVFRRDRRRRQGYEPDRAIPPGETIVESMADKGYGVGYVAGCLGISENQMEDLLTGDLDLCVDIAEVLGELFGPPARFWLKLEKQHRETLARIGQERPGGKTNETL